MQRFSWLGFALSIIAAPIARAQSAEADPAAAPQSLQLALPLAAQQPVCAVPAGMPSIPDASDPVFFATGPTARLDAEELSAHTLAPLMAIRFDDGMLHLLVLGMPTRATSIGFSFTGWRPRWPIC
jgi:hypothetical protein